MKKLVLTVAVLLLVAETIANAGMTLGVLNSGGGGGSAVGPSCNNSLDFSQACNSQYIPVVFR